MLQNLRDRRRFELEATCPFHGEMLEPILQPLRMKSSVFQKISVDDLKAFLLSAWFRHSRFPCIFFFKGSQSWRLRGS